MLHFPLPRRFLSRVQRPGPALRSFRPELEILEDRTVPAVFNIASGDVPGLIAAINTANTNNQPDTINLAANGLYQIPAGSNPPTDPNNIGLPFIAQDVSATNTLTINGNGAALQANGNSFRIIWVTTGVLIANNLTLENSSIPPSCCGGAGMVVGTAGTAPANSTGTVNLTNVTFTSNIANNAGGAMYMYGPNSTATLTNCTITNNTVMNGGAAGGGGIVVAGPGDTLTITGSTISNNTSAGPAGGIRLNNNNMVVNITNSTISGNKSTGNGGGIYVSGTGNTVTITGSTLANNTSTTGSGGAIGIIGTNNTVNLISSTLTGNLASTNISAGCVFINGTTPTLNVTNSTLSGNTGGYSGGIYCKPGATVSITGSTLDTNTATDAYGPAVGMNTGVLNITNCTIAGNIANKGASASSGKGGALWISKSTVTIRNSTITGNMATSVTNGIGGGIYRFNPPGIMTITNTIIDGNMAAVSAPDFQDTLGNATVSFSLLGSTQGNTVVNGTNNNIVNAAPGLGSLQFNGGISTGAPTSLTPLRTVALLAGSPAIDKGSNAGAGATDERGPGFARILNGTVDMGAFEFQPPATTTTITSSATSINFGQSVTFTATVASTATGSNPIQGNVNFLDGATLLGTVALVNGTATFTTTALTSGTHTIMAQFAGFNQGDYSFSPSMASLSEVVIPPPAPPPPPPPPPPATPIFAVGTDAGSPTLVSAYDAQTRQLKFRVAPFGLNFTGGVRVAVGDVNGDGIPDIICGAGPGGGPLVLVLDGKTGDLINAFYAFTGASGTGTASLPNTFAFTGGLYVAAGDVNGDGIADIIVGADKGGGPQVEVFDGKTGAVLYNFFAFNAPGFTGGVRVAAGDVNGDGHADIICAAGPGGGPQFTVYDGATLTPIFNHYAFSTVSFSGGLYAAAGDVNGDGVADIIIGAGAGGGPQVVVYDGVSKRVIANFFAFNPGFTGGARVGAVTPLGAGHADILTAAGPHGGPQVEAFDGVTLGALANFFAFTPGFTGGLFAS